MNRTQIDDEPPPVMAPRVGEQRRSSADRARSSRRCVDGIAAASAGVAVRSAHSVRCSAIVSASRQTTASRQRRAGRGPAGARAASTSCVPLHVGACAHRRNRPSVLSGRRAGVSSGASEYSSKRSPPEPAPGNTIIGASLPRTTSATDAGPSTRTRRPPRLLPGADDQPGGRGDRLGQPPLEHRPHRREELLEVVVVVGLLAGDRPSCRPRGAHRRADSCRAARRTPRRAGS